MALIDEYYGGIFFKTPQQIMYEEITQEAPRRQERLITLGEQQIAAQKVATKEIIQSNLKGAGIVATEIAQQTRTMEVTVQKVGQEISENIGQEVSLVGERMSQAVVELGERLTGGLYELQWQVAQVQCQLAEMHQTMKDILYVLRNSRNNEAQQLVKQGLRHYLNEEYTEAEQRFKRALKYDSTDYQVLMNLAFIEIHKNSVQTAFTYFSKALKLPENLDNLSRSRTLWAIARLYYTQKAYDKAFAYAEQALKLDFNSNPEGWFMAGIYAALAGKNDLALKHLHQAIQLNPLFFSKSAAETQRDLQHIRNEVFVLLAKLADEMFRKAATACNEVKKQREQLSTTNWSDEYTNLLDLIHTNHKQAVSVMQKPSYADCVRCLANILKVQQAIPAMAELDRLYTEQERILNGIEHQEKHGEKLQRTLPEQKEDHELNTGILAVLAIACGYIIPGLYVSSIADTGSKSVVFVLWPLHFLTGGITALIGMPNNPNPRGAGHIPHFEAGLKGLGVAVGIVIGVFLFMFIFTSVLKGKEALKEHRRNNMLADISQTQATLSQLKQQANNFEYTIREHISNALNYLTNIQW